MQIKELVVNLVNEGWIEQEKCGTTNLYWSFEYSQYKRKAQIYNQLKQSIVNLEQEKDRLSSHFGNVTGERNESNNREHNLVQYQKLKSMVDEVDEKLQSTKEVEMMEELKSSIEFFTDSIEIVISFFSHQSGTSVSVLKTEFEIPLEFDDLPELSSEFMR
ncbi:Meiotic nuclear division protein, putative [Candida maltosa Xu316]|uniref:Meiotic nuclear division protein, putative n=1 Tax=Candida maltosa (strain Xu316) TaxID=1245528 RepID=M3K0H3_CANMX|nr:Meiotic nuclear division protein, putative [Candida maltosa Xu316]